jgi:hypothetical protein
VEFIKIFSLIYVTVGLLYLAHWLGQFYYVHNMVAFLIIPIAVAPFVIILAFIEKERN